MGAVQREQGSVAKVVAFALGLSGSLALPVGDLSEPWKLPAGAGFALSAAALAFLAIERFRRNPLVLLVAINVAALGALAGLGGLVAPDADRRAIVRGLGLLIAFAVSLGAALWFARFKRELDRQVFQQAAAVGFFAIVLTVVAYGVAREAFGIGEIDVRWIGSLGVIGFAALMLVFEARYT